MNKNIELESKKIYILRCANATLYSALLQYFHLAIYLLLVNFSIFHPVIWIISTVRLIFSLYTWLYMIPLLFFIIINGIMMGRLYYHDKYYATRFAKLYNTAPTKAISLIIHVIIGIFTTWLYSVFLTKDYSKFYIECYEDGNYCLNEKHIFLMLNGIFASIYYFYKENIKKTNGIDFPIIQNSLYSAIRSQVYTIIYKSFKTTYWPTLLFATIYYITGSLIIRPYISSIFGYDIDSKHFSIFDLKFFLYNWMIFTHILSNMKLMNFLFALFLTESEEFPIVLNTSHHQDYNQMNLTLTDALSCEKIPITQLLAALDLYTLANHTNSVRRTQIFALSIPGGHPYNWNLISNQCLNIIDNYCKNLTDSMAKVTIVPNNNHIFPSKTYSSIQTPATQLADKIRFRQFNENMGIRNMTNIQEDDTIMQSEQQQIADYNDPCNRINAFLSIINDKLLAIKTGFIQTSGVNYWFHENEQQKISYLINTQHQLISWTSQSIATLAAHSLHEDKYGVVQDKLCKIFKSLLNLKHHLDNIAGKNMLDVDAKQNCLSLRNSVRRSIYTISTAFGDYIPDLIVDANDLRIIQNYVNYKES